MIKAVVFDIDGTLLDSKDFIFGSYEYALPRHGYSVPGRTVLATYVGRELAQCYREIAAGCDAEALCATHREFQSRHGHLIMPYAGLREMLEVLRSAKLKLGAFSTRKNIIPSLERAHIAGSFGVAIGGEHVQKHKPDPEGLFTVLANLGVPPAHAIMVGDTRFDIEAGKRAKVALTIGITHGFGTRDDLEDADHTVDSLAALVPLLTGR